MTRLVLFLPLWLLLVSEVLLHQTAEAFVIIPSLQQSVVGPIQQLAATKSSGSSVNDESLLAGLQHEYKVLQEQLYNDIAVTHDENDAELVEEHMLEIIQGANTLHKHQQYEKLQAAEEEYSLADANIASARSLKQKALDHLISTEKQAHDMQETEKFAESIEQQHEDYKLLKDLGKEHNSDIDVIHEAERLELQFGFDELEAKHKIDAAQFLLQELANNERILQATLDKLRDEKKEHEEELLLQHATHRSFLDKVKDSIYAHPDLLSKFDPHIL